MAKPKAKAKINSESKDRTLVYYIILAVISFAVYANSLSNDFVFDDESVVLGDPTITSLSNIPKYFTGEQGFHKVIGRYYRPVVSASYTMDCAIWGLKPFGFHLTNVLIHVINVLLLFRLLMLMFEKSQSKFKDYAILIGTIIFAFHPVHTEAVAWVSGRTDSLSCTFFFAAFIYYLKYSKVNKNLFLVLMLLFYMLALLAKEMAVTLPVLIILYDIIAGRLSISEAIKQKFKVYSALILLSVLYFVLRWAVLKDVPQRETYFYFFGRDFATVFYTMLQTIPVYFKLSVIPYGMVYHYSGYLPYISSPLEFGAIFSICFILIMGFSAYYLYSRVPAASYRDPVFLCFSVPVLNIIPTMNFMADRFRISPSAFKLYCSCGNIEILFNKECKHDINGIRYICYSLCVYDFFQECGLENNDVLFLSAQGKPGTVLYVNIIGNIYANKGQFDVAEQYYRKALDLKVESVLANNNLGKVFMVKENFDSAYYYMYKAHLLDTLSPEPMHALAQLYQRSDKLPEAILWLEKIQTITPNYMNSAQMLEELKAKYGMMQNSNLSSGDMNKVSGLEKSSYKYYQEKNYEKAIVDLKELIRLNPAGAAGYYNNIGMCYFDREKYSEASENFRQAISSNPKFSTGYNNLGTCYERLGDKQKAIENYKKALDVDPNNQNAKDNLEKIKSGL
jgi:tetratricopeptide (TPR) repeat protein